ncbi:hypothetical protein [Aquipuribacter sp. MA13-6]|uniref:hypothetical protein n=1 Tax=unclassified Aquipuribacter TaxID=2635084 RepID=UPI003EE908E7
MGQEEQIEIPLAADELTFLRAALLDWGGPARPNDALALAMGFSAAGRVSGEAWELWERIDSTSALTVADWRRTLLAAEIVFVSDVYGSGLDWPITTGLDDAESIEVLRRLQLKMARHLPGGWRA